MAKQWYRIEQHQVTGIVHVQRMSGYHIVAQTQLATDVAYTDAEIMALVDAITPQAQNAYGNTEIDRWWTGFSVCYERVARELDASDPTPRLGGLPTEDEYAAEYKAAYERAIHPAEAR